MQNNIVVAERHHLKDSVLKKKKKIASKEVEINEPRLKQ